MKKAIGGEKKEKEKLSEKKERGKRSKNAWQSNKLRKVAISRKKSDFGKNSLKSFFLKLSK